MSCSIDDENEQNEFGGYASFMWDLADWFRDSAVGCSKDKPIFTQAMHESGTLPLVGMECMVVDISLMNHEYEKCVILFIGIHKVVYTSESCIERFSNLDEVKFKPVDNRDDEEKAFDKFLSDEYNSNIAEFQGSESDVDFIVGLQSAWKAAINFKTKGE